MTRTRFSPLGIGFLVGLVLVWEVAASLFGGIAPTAILSALIREAGLFGQHVAVTAFEAVAGLALALTFALLTSSAFALSRRANEVAMPLVIASQTVPLVAISPLLAALIGDGLLANILITAWLCWFPAVIAFTHGFLHVHPERLSIFRVASGTRWQIYRNLRLPGASGAIVSGVRAAAGFAVIGAIVAEYGVANSGLGAIIIQHVREIHVLPPDALGALVVVCALLGTAVTWGAYAVAKFALRPWLVDEA
jgi:ABC-type nitrate/sulfonate/bicarbonate transport system permease component